MSTSCDKPLFASALSEAADPAQAVDEVVHKLAAQIEGPVDLVIAFATAEHAGTFDLLHQRLWARLRPRLELGMTAEGVIGDAREVERRPGLSVLACRLPEVNIEPFTYEEIDWQAVAQSPQALPAMIGQGHAVKLILLLADPFSTPISKMLPLFNRGFRQTPIIGGMASAAAKPDDNRLLYNGRVLEQGAVGLLMSGRIDVQCTVSQGCRPIGKPLVITKSQRHVVQQLSGRNALEVVQEMVRKLSAEDRQLVQSHGLLVGRVINEYKSRFGRGDFLIRSISGVDEESGYIGVADTAVRTGQTVQFQVRDKQTAEQDLAFLLEAQKLHGQAGAALLFSCNGRGTRLFDAPDTDARILRQALGPVPLAGCFAAGEIGPVGEENFLHGHTVSLVTFRAE